MCVLRVTGANFDAEGYLRTSALRPCNVFRAGDPRVPSRPHGSVWSTSGFTVAVSEAEWSDLSRQVADACGFIERHADELRALALSEAVENVRLDFPIERRDGVFAQFSYFPPGLVRAAGNLGIGLELSSYAVSDQDEEDNDSGSA